MKYEKVFELQRETSGKDLMEAIKEVGFQTDELQYKQRVADDSGQNVIPGFFSRLKRRNLAVMGTETDFIREDDNYNKVRLVGPVSWPREFLSPGQENKEDLQESAQYLFQKIEDELY